MKINLNNLEISEITGFDNGDKFETETDVKSYFTIENMVFMFPDFDTNYWSQTDLDAMAIAVIENHWHMV